MLPIVSILFTVPEPTVRIQSDPASPIYPVGVVVTLTCTVELSPAAAVDIPVAVRILWLYGMGPLPDTNEDFVIVQPVSMGSIITYTSTATINSFGREQSGTYRCIALINSTDHNQLLADNLVYSIGSGMAQITTGKFYY